MDNDLVFPMEITDGSISNSMVAGKIGNVDIELVSADAANRIRKIEELIKKLNLTVINLKIYQ